MVTISPFATVMSLLRLAEDIRTAEEEYPNPVDMKMFLTGPQLPPDALNRSTGLFACQPDELDMTEKLPESTACLVYPLEVGSNPERSLIEVEAVKDVLESSPM